MATGLAEPFPGHYDASDPFGNIGIRDPNGPGHLGSDWNGLPVGTPIPAIANGVIVAKDYSDGNGWYVTQSIGDTAYFAGYIHMNGPAYVSVGQTITQGTILGPLGNTGSNSYGAHLHITISNAPGAGLGLGDKIDPYAYITGHLGPGGTKSNVVVGDGGMLSATTDGGGNFYVDGSGLLQKAGGDANVYRKAGGEMQKAA